MTDRDTVLRKIRALLQKTVANGCPMEEALAAHAKARKLIDEYQVSHEELYGTGPGQQWRAEPEPEPEPEQAYARSAGDPEFRSSMTARLANALHWTFSGLAALLLLAAVLILYLFAPGNVSDFAGVLVLVALLACPALLAWLIGRTCHYVLGGDASALWERALIARARRSAEFRKFAGVAALLVVGGIAWLIADGQRQEALRKQQYEQQLQADALRQAQQAEAERQAEAREAAQRKAAQEQEAKQEEAQRQAAIAAQQAAAEHEVAAERAAVISAADLSVSGVTLRNEDASGARWGPGGVPKTESEIEEHEVLTSTITNDSGRTLRYVEFEVTLKDCLLGPDQCQVVGQENHKPLVDIPPNQTRTFTAYLHFPNLPPLQGQRFFSWRIVTASSCSQENLAAHKCAESDPPPDRPQSSLQGWGPPEPQTASQSSPPLANGWIGAEIEAITPGIAMAWGLKRTAGAFVDQPQPNSPAVKAGIKSGDVITAINGKPVGDARQLAQLIGAMAPGTTVTLDLIHDDEQRTVSLTLGTSRFFPPQ